MPQWTAHPVHAGCTWRGIYVRRHWSGEVLVAHTPPDRDLAPAFRLPDLDDWRRFLEQLIADPSGLTGHSILKHSGQARVIRASLPARPRTTASEVRCRTHDDSRSGVAIRGSAPPATIDVVCKCARARSVVRRVPDMVGWKQQRRRFRLAVDVYTAGTRTPLPLACVQRRGRADGWLITEYVPDLVELDDVVMARLSRLNREPLDANRRSAEVKRGIIRAVAGLLHDLDRNGFVHRDLKATNIMLTDWDDPSRVTAWLVDLDGLARMGKLRLFDRRRRTRALVRLAASLLEYEAVTRTDYARFLRVWPGTADWQKAERRRLFRDLALRATAYAARSKRRKTGKLDGFGGEVYLSP